MKTLAIVLSWKRESNLQQVVDGLKSQSFIDEVLIWHNCPSKKKIDDCLHIVSDINLGCSIRYQLATLLDYDYYFLSDDDYMIVNDISNKAMPAIEQFGKKSIIGAYGANINYYKKDNGYSQGLSVGHNTNRELKPGEIRKVDIVKGRFQIISRENIMKIQSSRFNTPILFEEDDIRANVAVQHANKCPSILFSIEHSDVVELSAPYARNERQEHSDNRDRAIRDAISLGWSSLIEN